jgi:hypothetical protein
VKGIQVILMKLSWPLCTHILENQVDAPGLESCLLQLSTAFFGTIEVVRGIETLEVPRPLVLVNQI